MVSAISPATQPQAAAQPAATLKPTAQAKPQPVQTDTVQLSAAAALHQELTETSAQTAKEAAGGNIQAQRLLAKEAADKNGGL